MVIIAPTTTHVDTKSVCDFETYSLRMWCRAEVFSFYCRRGLDDMYKADKEGASYRLTKVEENQVDDTILVFEGQCTCCARKHEKMSKCDKETLRDVFLGIYATMLITEMAQSSKTLSSINGDAEHKLRIFPKKFTGRLRVQVHQDHRDVKPHQLATGKACL